MTCLDTAIEAAVTAYLDALDGAERASAKLYIQKAGQAADESWQGNGPTVTNLTVSEIELNRNSLLLLLGKADSELSARESVQLHKVLALYEQEIDQHRSKPSYQKLKSRKFKVRNERNETGVLVRVRNGRTSALKGERVSAKQRDSVHTETSCSTKTISVERKHNRLLLLRDCRHEMTEEDLRKETPAVEVVHPQGNVKNRARIVSKSER